MTLKPTKCEDCGRGRTGFYGPSDFEIPEELDTKLTDWMLSRPEAPNDPIRARYSFVFTPSTIGSTIMVIDKRTGDKLDLTEDVNW